MAEFCSTCPIRAACVGEVALTIAVVDGITAESSKTLNMKFEDQDGIKTGGTWVDMGSGPIDTDVLHDVLDARIDRCKAPMRNSDHCAALSHEVVRTIIKKLQVTSEPES